MKLGNYSILSIVLTVCMVLSISVPGSAAPVFIPKAPAISSGIIQVQHGRHHFERRGQGVYLNGHRGFRHHRPGYRRHNGWWFPEAAFMMGALMGGAISQSHGRHQNDAHIRWCYDRYRSYRASDNTYQPYNGPRRPCRSPYY